MWWRCRCHPSTTTRSCAWPSCRSCCRGCAAIGRRQTQLGLRLLLLTGVRTGELRQATPDQFDLDRGLWIIPPDVVKQLQLDMRKKRQQPKDIPPYIVPLSIQAMEIVRHLLDEFKPAQRHLFRHDSDLKKRDRTSTRLK